MPLFDRTRNAFLAGLLVLLCAGAALFAQTVTGKLTGVVSDASGAVVPDASITISGPKGINRSAKTDLQGRYTFEGLPPGSYRLRVNIKGFAPVDLKDLAIAAGQSLAQDIGIVVTLGKQEVTVAETGRVEVDPASSVGVLVLKGADLETLSDDPDELQDDLMALAGPAAGPNGGQIFIDGFTGGRMPPKASIREVRINQSPFAAEYDKLGFGRIEIFTKPGTDQFHGQAFFNFGDSALNSRNPFSPTKPPYQRKMLEGNVSGPLNGKTSFFVDAEQRSIEDTSVINALVLDPSFLMTPFQQAVLNPSVHTTFSPRIDRQLSTNHTLVARYTWEQTERNNDGLDTFSLPSQAVDRNSTEHTAQITETAVLGPTTINEIRAQYERQRSGAMALSSDPATQVMEAFTSGGASAGVSHMTESRLELNDVLSMTRNRHTIKLGGRLRGVKQSNESTQNYNGTFTFTSLNAYRITEMGLRDGLTGQQIRTLGGGASQFMLTAGNPLASVSQVDAGLFVQDDWRLHPRFTLSGGLRYELQNNIGDWRDLAPRIGFAWGLGSGSAPATVVRGGFGLFYDRFGEDLVMQARRLDGLRQQQYVVPNPDFYPTIPSASLLEGNLRQQAIRKIDANLRAPYIAQSAFSLERQLPKNITLSLTYTNSRGFHVLRSRNINAPLPGTYDARVPGSGVRPYSGGDIYLYESSGVFRQQQVIANVNARINTRFSLFGFLMWSRAKSNADGAGSFPFDQYDLTGEYGRAGFDVHRRAFVGGSITAPFGLRLNPFIMASSGRPFNITLGRDLNGDSQFNDRPAFATDLTRASVARTAFGDFDTNPLPGQTFIPRNYGDGPGMFNFNLRLSRTFGFGGEKKAAEGAGPGGLSGVLMSAGGGPGGGHGPGGHGGPGGGRGGPGGGGPGGMFRESSGNRYSITLSVSARNLFNTVNLAPPIGNLNSPLFGTSNALGGGMGPRGTDATANRMLELQIRFSF